MARTKKTKRTISTPPSTPVTAGTSDNDATNNSSEDGAGGGASVSSGLRSSPRRRQGQGAGKTSEAATTSECEGSSNVGAPAPNGGDDSRDANDDASNEDLSSVAAPKDTNDEGGGSSGLLDRFKVLTGNAHASFLHLHQYTSPGGCPLILNINANTVKTEISSSIQNTLSGNPIDAEQSNVKRLGNSIMSSFMCCKPESDVPSVVTDVSYMSHI